MKPMVSAAAAAALALALSTVALADVQVSGERLDGKTPWPQGLELDVSRMVQEDRQGQRALVDWEDGLRAQPGQTLYLPLMQGTEPYTGPAGKDWKISLVERGEAGALPEDGTLEESSLYRAKAQDEGLTRDAWYLRLELEAELASLEAQPLEYQAALSERGTPNQTQRVTIRGSIQNPAAPGPVAFDWPNDVYGPAVWQVRPGDSGTAVFNFADEALFTVRMYSEDAVMLDYTQEHDRDILARYDADLDFHRFLGELDQFSAAGELILPAAEGSVLYEIVDGELVERQAEYDPVHEAFILRTRTLGEYAVAHGPVEEQ